MDFKNLNNISIEFLQKLIDEMPFNIALLDNQGIIRLVNKYWIEFGRENGLENDEIGVNYIEITRKAYPLEKETCQVLDALERAISGEKIHTFVEYHVHINTFNYEGKVWVIVVHENVTESVLNREKEEKITSRFKKLFNNMNEGVVFHEWIRDENGKIIDYIISDVNEAFYLHTNLYEKNIIGMPATILYGINPPPYFDVYLRVYENQEPEQFETFYSPMNRYFWISAIPWDNGFVTIFLDITSLKKQQKELQDNLEKKEFLFRELQHRAKNTFASIASLIGLAALDYKGEIFDILQHLKAQVSSMAKVYDILYRMGETNNINLSEYLNKILNGFFDTFPQIFSHVKKDIKLEEITISSKKASLVGLWLVELLNNAIKYAFGEKKEGWISINLTKLNDQIKIVYSDGGRGEDEASSLKIDIESSGFGSKIMKIIVDELEGKEEIFKDNGLKIVLTFPLSVE